MINSGKFSHLSRGNGIYGLHRAAMAYVILVKVILLRCADNTTQAGNMLKV